MTQANDNQFRSHAERFSILWPILNAKRKETRRVYKPRLNLCTKNLVRRSAEHLAGWLVFFAFLLPGLGATAPRGIRAGQGVCL